MKLRIRSGDFSMECEGSDKFCDWCAGQFYELIGWKPSQEVTQLWFDRHYGFTANL